MPALSRVLRLRREEYHGRDKAQLSVLCHVTFRELMNEDSLPKKVKVTVSIGSIPGAARVPVLLRMKEYAFGPRCLCGQWIDWTGVPRPMWARAAGYLKQLGIPLDEWTDVWIDWAPIQPKKGNRR